MGHSTRRRYRRPDDKYRTLAAALEPKVYDLKKGNYTIKVLVKVFKEKLCEKTCDQDDLEYLADAIEEAVKRACADSDGLLTHLQSYDPV